VARDRRAEIFALPALKETGRRPTNYNFISLP
jgi:hypothetical protein